MDAHCLRISANRFFSQIFGVKINTEPHICRTKFGILYVYIIHYYKDSKLSSRDQHLHSDFRSSWPNGFGGEAESIKV